MTHYLYPQNLKASANMWFWSLKDFAILGIAALLSIVMLVELRFLLPFRWQSGPKTRERPLWCFCRIRETGICPRPCLPTEC